MRVLARLLGFLGRHRWRVALAIVLGTGTMASNVGLLAVAAYLIAASALHVGLSVLTAPMFLVQVFGGARAGFRYTERLVSHGVTFRLLADLRTWLYGRLEPLSPARLQERRSGDLLARLVGDVEELENIYLRALSPAVVAAAICALTFVALYVFDPSLAFVALGFLAFSAVGVPLLAGVLARSLGRRERELRAELGAEVVDGIQGVQDLLALGRADDQRQRVADLGAKLARVQRRTASITGLQTALNDLTMNLAMLAVLVLAIPLVNEGRIPGVFLAFVALLTLGSFEAVQPLGAAFQSLGRSLGAGERVFEISDSKPQVIYPDEPLPPPPGHDLRFDRVSFRYEEDEPLVLDDISFEVKPGGRVAVVGPSGSGKSTLANLALRFWDPADGEVRLGGRDLRAYAEEDLRERVGIAAQDTHLFNDTLRGNLLLARPGATDTEIESALEKARLGEEFLGRLPQGLDTPLGEQGLRLSGGERQRLAVARALLEDAPVLVLDEPTANLDPQTEKELLETLYDAPGRATLVITHRLVLMERMDEILVLEGGRIAERGTHAELLEKDGLYKRMVEVQDRMLATTS